MYVHAQRGCTAACVDTAVHFVGERPTLPSFTPFCWDRRSAMPKHQAPRGWAKIPFRVMLQLELVGATSCYE
jgi:hypothetical protein